MNISDMTAGMIGRRIRIETSYIAAEGVLESFSSLGSFASLEGLGISGPGLSSRLGDVEVLVELLGGHRFTVTLEDSLEVLS